eukprot:2979111-Rhodomonas_salina.3
MSKPPPKCIVLPLHVVPLNRVANDLISAPNPLSMPDQLLKHKPGQAVVVAMIKTTPECVMAHCDQPEHLVEAIWSGEGGI